MELSHETRGAVEVVTLSGKLDATVASTARDKLRALIDGGRERLVIDLAAVSFVDSSGLSALVTAFKTSRNAGGDVALTSLQPTVRSVMELTRLHHVFGVYDDVDTAISALDIR